MVRDDILILINYYARKPNIYAPEINFLAEFKFVFVFLHNIVIHIVSGNGNIFTRKSKPA